MRKNIRICGIGGQGIIKAGEILGGVLAKEGFEVVQTQKYGSASRGGETQVDLIISDEEIFDLEITKTSYTIYLHEKTMDGLKKEESDYVIADEKLKKRTNGIKSKIEWIPYSELAQELGEPKASNMVALGSIIAHLGITQLETTEEIIKEKFPKKEKTNINALEAGYYYSARQLKKNEKVKVEVS